MRILLLLSLSLIFSSCHRQKGYTKKEYTNEVLNRMTPVKDQGDSETCWIYAMLATIETEHLAWGDSVNLSPYYIEKMMEQESDAPRANVGRVPPCYGCWRNTAS